MPVAAAGMIERSDITRFFLSLVLLKFSDITTITCVRQREVLRAR